MFSKINLECRLILIRIIHVVFLLISADFLYNASAQSVNCPVEAAVISPGRAIIKHQSNTGFCNEWIVGPVATSQVNTKLFVTKFLA